MSGPGRYRLAEHTADVRVVAEGGDFASVATAMLHALAEVSAGGRPGGAAEMTVSWRPTSPDPPLALVELLNEAIYQREVHGRVALGFTGDETGGELALSPAAAAPVREVKAATYSDARCAVDPAGVWRAEVTLDL